MRNTTEVDIESIEDDSSVSYISYNYSVQLVTHLCVTKDMNLLLISE